MNSKHLACLLLALALLIGAPSAAQAATGAKIEIPFSFTAGEATLPAGIYTVERSAATGIASLKDENGRRYMFMTRDTGSSIPHSQSSLLFVKNQGEMTLAEIRLNGTSVTSLPAAPEEVPMTVTLLY